LIPPEPADHSANLPNWNSIELPGAPEEPKILERQSRFEHAEAPQLSELLKEETWEVTEGKVAETIVESATDVRQEMAKVSRSFEHLVSEGSAQYRESIRQTLPALKELQYEAVSVWRHMLSLLRQPVWIPLRGNKTKEYKRGTLFFLDVIRFGGTFAVIFVGLFLALNYQSFWQIAAARVTPLIEAPSMDATVDPNMPVSAKNSSTSAGLLAYLPDVGPPVDTLIIPKIHVNVPIVAPPTQALLEQNWDQVEKDIQDSLIHGAVHYPGTARAGQAGNFFVTMHSSNYLWIKSAYNTIGARLHELKAGDEYWVYYNGDRHRYIVKSTKEVSPSDVSVLDQPADERLSTLMTCTPVGTTLRRLVVVAQEVDPISGVPLKVGEHAIPAAPKIGVSSLPI
jgi:LPXTG-site transpeptidase (sortase) family protein